MLNAIRASTSSDVGGRVDDSNVEARHEDPDEDDFQCAPCESGGTVEPRRHPGNPTQEEVAEHELIHCPFRSWCPICIEAQGKEDPHYKETKRDIINESPVVSMDYKEVSEYDDFKNKVIMIVCRDKWTKSVATHVVKAKGSNECAGRLVEFLDSFGYNEMVLKSDNEAAIKVLRDEVIAKRRRPTISTQRPSVPSLARIQLEVMCGNSRVFVILHGIHEFHLFTRLTAPGDENFKSSQQLCPTLKVCHQS